MKLIKTINLTAWNDFIKSRVISFWEARQVKFNNTSNNQLMGRRGSLLWNFITYDMSKIATEIKINIGNDLILNCTLDINTSFQIITEWNMEYWRLELDTFESYLLNFDLKEEEWEQFRKENRKASILWTISYGRWGHKKTDRKKLK